MAAFVPVCFRVQVRHRWCELVVKHAYVKAYGDVEHFLVHDQVTFDLHGTSHLHSHLFNDEKKLTVCVCVCFRLWVCIYMGS